MGTINEFGKIYDANLDRILNKVIEDIDFNKFVDKLPKSKTISKTQSIKNITESYHKEKLVFVLGAGISLEFGVPSWELLLQDLIFQIDGIKINQEIQYSMIYG